MKQFERRVAGGVFGTASGKIAGGDPGIVDQDVKVAVMRAEVVVRCLVVGGFGDVELENISAGVGSGVF